MKKIIAFAFVTLDGYYAGPNGIDWVTKDEENSKFSDEQSKLSDTLIFGRETYEMMASYWPTEEASKNSPVTAKTMQKNQKIVFSKSMRKADEGPNWTNIKVLHEIDPQEIVKMKEQDGGNAAILGSGSILQQFSNLGLIDEYSLLVHPIILGKGKSLFKGVKNINLKLTNARTFKNGNVLLTYKTISAN